MRYKLGALNEKLQVPSRNIDGDVNIVQISHLSNSFLIPNTGLHLFTSIANQNSVRYSVSRSYFIDIKVQNVNIKRTL